MFLRKALKAFAPLMLLISWDQVVHNCDGTPTMDVLFYTYRTAMRFPVGSQTCAACDENGENCVEYECPVYNLFEWSPLQSIQVSDSRCNPWRCEVVAPDGRQPAVGEVVVTEVSAFDGSGNADCGL